MSGEPLVLEMFACDLLVVVLVAHVVINLYALENT